MYTDKNKNIVCIYLDFSKIKFFFLEIKIRFIKNKNKLYNIYGN